MNRRCGRQPLVDQPNRVAIHQDHDAVRNIQQAGDLKMPVQSNNTPIKPETAAQCSVALPPCLPGCDTADRRAAELADRRRQFHTCVKLIGKMPSAGRVEVIAGVGADGTTERATVAAVDVPDVTWMSADDAAALAQLLAIAAQFAKAVTR